MLTFSFCICSIISQSAIIYYHILLLQESMRKVEHDYRLNVIKYYKDFSYGARRGSSRERADSKDGSPQNRTPLFGKALVCASIIVYYDNQP